MRLKMAKKLAQFPTRLVTGFCYNSPVRRDEFNFHLPQELIAQQPPPRRRDARLLCLDGNSGALADRRVIDLLALAQPGDLFILNDTKVMPARLFGRKPTGGRVEILVERIINDHEVIAHLKANKTVQVGAAITVESEYELLVLGRDDDLFRLQFASPLSVLEILHRVGHIPLPPYINRADAASDQDRYQTVYARRPGAVAAPTAGLHFDQQLLDELQANGVQLGYVTLHIGAGTFQPVRSERIEDHAMHSEYFEVSEALCEQIERTRALGNRIIAIGTTCVRALESAAISAELRPMRGDTKIFIYPGYQFKVVDAILTNFHLPESTLLMLISAFAGRENVLRAYDHAVKDNYRFFSYGDAMWITRRTAS
jgi:S-adenosylmethionine:tRNA ribosyltransferase-isomerase